MPVAFLGTCRRSFFSYAFCRADRLTLATNKQFIADLMPRNPIYVKLLDKTAQEVIGKPHPSTQPALNILLKEGFRYNEYIDIFDAGPTIEAPLKDIKTCAQSRVLPIKGIDDAIESTPFLISNTSIDFRATLGIIAVNEQEQNLVINTQTPNC